MRRLRVLLLDEGFISGTLTAAGLRRAGCEVHVVAAAGGRGSCADADGSWRLAPRVGDPRLGAVLDRIVAAGPCDVIYPVTEPLQQLIWDREPSWESRVFPRVPLADRAPLLDKRVMSARMAAAGVRVPREHSIEAPGDVDLAVARLGLPLVIKGHSGRGGQATRVCETAGAVHASVEELRAIGVLPFAQRFIDGATCLAGGLFDRGRALRFFAGRKTVQFPARVGPAAEILSDDDASLREIAMAVFAAANVSGLASIDVIRDGSGAFHFLELNPRPWGSIEAASIAGVDLFEALAAWWRSGTLEPDASFSSGLRVPVFPLYLLSPPFWRSGHLAAAIRADWQSAIDFALQHPRQALHHLHRLTRVGINWSHPVLHK